MRVNNWYICFLRTSKGNLDTSEVEHVVLDEVDRMLDMGFAPSVEEILQYSYHQGLFNEFSEISIFYISL